MEDIHTETHQDHDLGSPAREHARLWQKLPYIIVLSMSVFGVAYANVTRQNLSIYWEVLAIGIGCLCVYTDWPNREDRRDLFRLIWTQILHWATFLIMMNIMLLPAVQSLLPAPANSLALLMLLALGTFLAGVNLLSLEICFLGLAMGLAVAAIAWLKQLALFLILGAVFAVGLALALWPRRN